MLILYQTTTDLLLKNELLLFFSYIPLQYYTNDLLPFFYNIKDEIKMINNLLANYCRLIGIYIIYHQNDLNDHQIIQNFIDFLLNIVQNQLYSLNIKLKASWALATICDFSLYANKPKINLFQAIIFYIINLPNKLINNKLTSNLIRIIGNLSKYTTKKQYYINFYHKFYYILKHHLQYNIKVRWNTCYHLIYLLDNSLITYQQQHDIIILLLDLILKHENYKVCLNAITAINHILFVNYKSTISSSSLALIGNDHMLSIDIVLKIINIYAQILSNFQQQQIHPISSIVVPQVDIIPYNVNSIKFQKKLKESVKDIHDKILVKYHQSSDSVQKITKFLQTLNIL